MGTKPTSGLAAPMPSHSSMIASQLTAAALEDAAYYDYIMDTEADEEEFNEDAEEDWQHECEERFGFEQL